MNTPAIKLAGDLLVKPFEGYARRLPNGDCQAYPDPGTGDKPWTIGWGCTGPDINPGTVWTQQRAQTELDHHLLKFYQGLVNLSPSVQHASTPRVAALISFVYNCGLGNYRISTLKRRVDSQNWAGAGEEILKWNKAAGRVLAGLTRRRKAEALLLIG